MDWTSSEGNLFLFYLINWVNPPIWMLDRNAPSAFLSNKIFFISLLEIKLALWAVFSLTVGSLLTSVYSLNQFPFKLLWNSFFASSLFIPSYKLCKSFKPIYFEAIFFIFNSNTLFLYFEDEFPFWFFFK